MLRRKWGRMGGGGGGGGEEEREREREREREVLKVSEMQQPMEAFLTYTGKGEQQQVSQYR